MLSRIFGNQTFTLLEKGLEASKLREQVTAHNIANNDTPDFKRSYVEFEQYLAAALNEEQSEFEMKRTRRGHSLPEETDLDGVTPMVIKDNSTTLRMDGNNVDIEHEKVEQAKNQIHYNTLVEQLNSELRRLRIAMGKG